MTTTAYVTKFLFPETRETFEIEDEESDCAACEAASRSYGWEVGSVGFLVVETPARAIIRRVEKVADHPSEFFCVIVSEEEARREIDGGPAAEHVEEARQATIAASILLRNIFFPPSGGRGLS